MRSCLFESSTLIMISCRKFKSFIEFATVINIINGVALRVFFGVCLFDFFFLFQFSRAHYRFSSMEFIVMWRARRNYYHFVLLRVPFASASSFPFNLSYYDANDNLFHSSWLFDLPSVANSSRSKIYPTRTRTYNHIVYDARNPKVDTTVI